MQYLIHIIIEDFMLMISNNLGNFYLFNTSKIVNFRLVMTIFQYQKYALIMDNG
jgi:hypothetical protein